LPLAFIFRAFGAGRCSALAPGFNIPRLWRWTVFGARPWLSYSAPLALDCVRRLPWLSYSAPLALAWEFKASSVSSFVYTACYILSPCSRVGLNETWQQSRDVRRPSTFI
jgi:hypothetical protein